MKQNFEIRDTYDGALEYASKCIKPMYILHGNDGKFWIVDLSRASKLMKQGYIIASREAKTMEIIRKSPDKYGLQMVGKTCHRIVKILREYKDVIEAERDMVKLLTGEITEQELVEGGKE